MYENVIHLASHKYFTLVSHWGIAPDYKSKLVYVRSLYMYVLPHVFCERAFKTEY